MKYKTKLRHRIIATSIAVFMVFGTVSSLAELKTDGTALADSQATVTSGNSTSEVVTTSDVDYGLQDSEVSIQASTDDYLADGLTLGGDQSVQDATGTIDIDLSPDGSGSKLAQSTFNTDSQSTNNNSNAVVNEDNSDSEDNNYVAPPVVTTGKLRVRKLSSNSSVPTSGDYSLSGALFYVYADYNRTQKVAELKTGSDGYTSYVDLSPGTYYIKEICAPNNYKLNTANNGGTVTLGGTVTINHYNEPVTGGITIQKSSSDTSISNTSAYSLAGAVFNVYNSSGTLVRTMTTDSNGKASCSGFGLTLI